MLSREQIIETAVELLDAGGEDALTTRALTQRLSTAVRRGGGPGLVVSGGA